MSERLFTVTLAEPVIIAGVEHPAGEAKVNARQRATLKARGLLAEPAADTEQTESRED